MIYFHTLYCKLLLKPIILWKTHTHGIYYRVLKIVLGRTKNRYLKVTGWVLVSTGT